MTQSLMDIPNHPAADLFPMMSEKDLRSLAGSIEATGLLQPVVLTEEDGVDMVLDGRNRLRACVLIGAEPKTIRYGGSDPYGFVLSANLSRRHLTESQRAMIGAHMAKLRHGIQKRDDAQICASSQEDAAKLLKVSRRNVQNARRILEHATPEVIAAVEAGSLTVNAAQASIGKPKKTINRKAEALQMVVDSVSPEADSVSPEADSVSPEATKERRWNYNREATVVGRTVRDWAVGCRKRRYPMSQVIATIEEMIAGLRQHTGGNDE